ncbi:MAG: tRNA (5-methylaminomethyl-2-thiouridine)(34)-methyltransferase MnmD [Saprospiraceae bacterium]|nr:tRNA (5-methylaminomethyl-2-thiouridine)(34)-methyltransferase MnmD [Saprospiraceae bacterium]HMW40221.1 tRNA (5-methylaminomethyl-2-thiouridine)(34)-methyltransferase MnmD [Saprospiraceae bacterium]HMX89103.1 tRNA (5-methylaminomethyl-2-thiouridine)(34)-methyltransferase MnmD [Saprospiraceae bacterium]HMZ40974.1 tRNA (5-methylaminomethyl-2-thiouridine)(34)-methyltransferase MnmD [Saprospiraceae bacterium]HNA65980.1 tRNA (5-methylaminomethyl-2-thiouridine)(34)-methyltransferase MnmD [Saprosp
MPEFEIIATRDGSPTIHSQRFGATYHSLHGAVVESMHVFINAGLNCFGHLKKIKIFELGFGTGLNALLTLDFGLSLDQEIEYTAIDLHPLPETVFLGLEYPQLDTNRISGKDFQSLHTCPWNQNVQITTNFSLTKIADDWLSCQLEPNQYDLFYLDAFGPTCQPELWSEDSMMKAHRILAKGGILVSYCAQGQFRRNLKSAGFRVEKLQGPPGKREMTRAFT